MTHRFETLELMTYNIRLGIETSLKSVADAILSLGVPDLLALQEIGVDWRMGERLDQPAALCMALALPFHAFAGALTDDDGGRFGVALLSRFPLRSVDVALLPRERDEQRVALRICLDTEPAVWVMNTHLSVHEPERIRQAAAVRRLALATTGPVIVMGDFNDASDSEVLNVLRGDPPNGLVLTDAFDATGLGPPETFSVARPHRRIDYVLSGRGLLPTGAARVAREVTASDHFPLCARVHRVAAPVSCPRPSW